MLDPEEKFRSSIVDAVDQFLTESRNQISAVTEAESDLHLIEPDTEGSTEADFPLSDPSVTQSITRSVDADGCEHVIAYFRVGFTSGEVHRALHLAIWPNFSRIPEVHVTVIEGAAASVKITQCQIFGLRIEVTLLQGIETPCSVVLEIVASCQSQVTPLNGK